MKLFFLDPSSRLAINIRRLRNYGFNTHNIIASDAGQNPRALIVLGNGSPEDEVIGIISHHLDGNRVVGIVKPTQHHLASLDQLRTYIELNVEKIMIIIDQDDWTLDDLLNTAERRIRDIAISPQSQPDTENRVRIYNCMLSNRRFQVIIVVSGLDDFPTKQHTIEDHLLKLAGFDKSDNPKESWRNLSSDERDNVFRRLQDRKVVEAVFPQQTCGCRRLE